MGTHHELRRLRETAGPQVFEDPDLFRGAFEDFAETDPHPGDVNLLADAIRLDSLARVRSMLGNGGAPEAVFADEGARLASLRGTRDVEAAVWALGALAYADGLADDALAVRNQSHQPSAGTLPLPASVSDSGKAGTGGTDAAEASTLSASTALLHGEPEHSGTGPAASPRATRALRHGLVAATGIAVVAGLLIVGISLGSRDADPNGTSAGAEPATTATPVTETPAGDGDEDEISPLVPLSDEPLAFPTGLITDGEDELGYSRWTFEAGQPPGTYDDFGRWAKKRRGQLVTGAFHVDEFADERWEFDPEAFLGGPEGTPNGVRVWVGYDNSDWVEHDGWWACAAACYGVQIYVSRDQSGGGVGVESEPGAWSMFEGVFIVEDARLVEAPGHRYWEVSLRAAEPHERE